MVTLDGTLDNLLSVYHRATSWEREDGAVYYTQQRDNIAAVAAPYKICFSAAIGAFAALSPNNDEAGNYRDLQRCVEYVACGTEDTPVPDVSSYPVNRSKALRMLRGEFPDNVLRGPKTLAFYHNTLDPHDPYWITVDGHMVSC